MPNENWQEGYLARKRTSAVELIMNSSSDKRLRIKATRARETLRRDKFSETPENPKNHKFQAKLQHLKLNKLFEQPQTFFLSMPLLT